MKEYERTWGDKFIQMSNLNEDNVKSLRLRVDDMER